MRPTILRVGLTGNIAVGKSTVARWMASFGCHVLDADILGHQCLEPSETTYDRVVDVFGPSVLQEDGTIDRSLLGARVFSDDDNRAKLEAIIHPAIRTKEQHQVDQIERVSGPSIVVTEAALLYETGSVDRYQRIVVVTAVEDICLKRLLERGLSTNDAHDRMATQMAQAEKSALADYVIDNSDTRQAAREATQIVCEQLQLDLAEWMAGNRLRST